MKLSAGKMFCAALPLLLTVLPSPAFAQSFPRTVKCLSTTDEHGKYVSSTSSIIHSDDEMMDIVEKWRSTMGRMFSYRSGGCNNSPEQVAEIVARLKASGNDPQIIPFTFGQMVADSPKEAPDKGQLQFCYYDDGISGKSRQFYSEIFRSEISDEETSGLFRKYLVKTYQGNFSRAYCHTYKTRDDATFAQKMNRRTTYKDLIQTGWHPGM